MGFIEKNGCGDGRGWGWVIRGLLRNYAGKLKDYHWDVCAALAKVGGEWDGGRF